jgi:DNA-binding PadR family transcriptional regulator
MTEKAVEETFEALFALTDLRQLFRDTKPFYRLNDEQRERVRAILERVRQSLRIIEEELIG